MTKYARHLWADRRAAIAAEFALVLPLFLIFVFGIIDAGRYLYTVNRAEKATQMGARYAVSTDMIPTGLATYSFATTGGIPQGSSVPQSSFGGATCTSTGCACNAGATCPPLGTASTTAFNNIVTRMRAIMPEIQAANVVVEYGYSGLGYSGDPNGPDVAPLVTVRLTGMNFQPITTLVFGATISIPGVPATLSLEDGTGNLAN